jgi:hypothetical protein
MRQPWCPPLQCFRAVVSLIVCYRMLSNIAFCFNILKIGSTEQYAIIQVFEKPKKFMTEDCLPLARVNIVEATQYATDNNFNRQHRCIKLKCIHLNKSKDQCCGAETGSNPDVEHRCQ